MEQSPRNPAGSSSTQPNDGYADHIGLVEKVSNGVITTIEGNTQGGKVARNTFKVGSGYIRGYAKPKYSGASGISSAKKTVEELAQEVLQGKWGNGQDRKNRLTAAGYDYSAVQKRVNQLLAAPAKKTIEELAREVIRGQWGNGADRKNRLTAAGYDYSAVQKKVNQLLSK